MSRCLKPQRVRREVEISLRRLNVEYIDLYQIHWPTDSETETDEEWRAIGDLIQEGKVRYAGVSNFTLSQHQRAHALRQVTSSQPSYNMILRDDEAGVLPYCAANNISVVVARPMSGGLLTGKFTKGRAQNLPEDDWRKRRSWFQEPELSANLELVDGLRPTAERKGCTVAQLAIAWILRRSEVTAVIAGARHPWQIEEDVQAADLTLSSEDITKIETLLNKRTQSLREIQSPSR